MVTNDVPCFALQGAAATASPFSAAVELLDKHRWGGGGGDCGQGAMFVLT
jgi:hypothetical protein